MAKLKLGAIVDGKDRNRFCGPSVISALTDLTTGEAARLIRMQTGKPCVMGTHAKQVLNALRACNIEAARLTFRRPRPTLAGWLRTNREERTTGRIFLIAAGNHWQLVSGRRYTCGRIREIVSIRDKRVKRRARVSEVWELTSDNVTRPEFDVSKPKPNPAHYQVRKLIRQYPEFDLSCEVEHREYGEYPSTSYWVQMGSRLEELAKETDHELRDCHGCNGIEEAQERLERMVAFAREHCPTTKEK
jgi:hypothetical protein